MLMLKDNRYSSTKWNVPLHLMYELGPFVSNCGIYFWNKKCTQEQLFVKNKICSTSSVKYWLCFSTPCPSLYTLGLLHERLPINTSTVELPHTRLLLESQWCNYSFAIVIWIILILSPLLWPKCMIWCCIFNQPAHRGIRPELWFQSRRLSSTLLSDLLGNKQHMSGHPSV